jgi:YHS domain-containing protein
MRPFRTALVLAISLAALGASAAPAGPLVNVDRRGIVLEGHDPVAFFTQGKPVRGLPAIRATHEGATYLFASEENRRLFEADPLKYRPQFGGFCALAVSLGRTAPISIDTWSIEGGRLLFQHNARAVRLWKTDPTGNLAYADRYWPRVVASGGKQIDVPQRF